MKKKVIIISIVAAVALALVGGSIGLYCSGVVDDQLESIGLKKDSGSKKRQVRHSDDDDIDETDETKVIETDASEETEPVAATIETQSELIKVAVINNDPNESSYRTAMDADLKEFFTPENGYDATFLYSMKEDEKVKGAESFITTGIDYLFVFTTDQSPWEDVLEEANEAGVKVIFFDSYLDLDGSLYEARIYADMESQGEYAVEWMDAQDLDEYNILHLEGVLGSMAQVDRTVALNEMADYEDNWNIVLEETAMWDRSTAQSIVTEAIDSGVEFNVIYADNEFMMFGAIDALDEAGITHGPDGDVMIVTFAGTKDALNEVLKGNWNFVVMESPYMSEYIDAVIKGYIPNGDVAMVDYGFEAGYITKEDVDNYGY